MIETMTTAEAAKELGVHPVTLRKWRRGSEQKLQIPDSPWMEDLRGLTWRFDHARKVVYMKDSIEWFKCILNRRKIKQCTKTD